MRAATAQGPARRAGLFWALVDCAGAGDLAGNYQGHQWGPQEREAPLWNPLIGTPLWNPLIGTPPIN